MPSKDQAVDIPFSGGMAEGAAPFVFNGPFVELAEDCTITKEGAYRRFPGGFSPTAPAGSVGGSRGITAFDGTLVQYTAQGPAQYNETLNSWRASNVLGFVPTQVRTDPLVSQSGVSLYNTQVAVSSGGFELYMWDEQVPGATPPGIWSSKGLGLRDPLGGWTIVPASTSALGAAQQGHQIVALGTDFLIGFTTVAGFQVWKLPQASVSTASLSHIVTSALGSSWTSTYAYNALHDCCLSTAGTVAYFLVDGGAGGAGNFYVYTVDSSGQVGTACNGASAGQGAFALAVDNAKVYVVESLSGTTSVRVSKVLESAITTGIAFTAIAGVITTASGTLPYRVRAIGGTNLGIHIAIEAYTTVPATDLPLYNAGVSVNPAYQTLPSAPYVEVGFYPTADGDLSTTYTEDDYRGYAHGYVLGSGFYYDGASRGPQILVIHHGVNEHGVGWSECSDGAPAGDNLGQWRSAVATGPFYGGVWLEVGSRTLTNGKGTNNYVFLRSLARVAWDSAYSDHTIQFIPGDPATSRRNRICLQYGSLSRCVGGVFAVASLVDTTSHLLRRCSVDSNPLPPNNTLTQAALYPDGACQHVWDGQHSFENTPHFGPDVAWVPVSASGTSEGDPYYGAPTTASQPLGAADLWSFYWEWSDAQNHLHRSATTSLTITVSAFTGTATLAYYYASALGGVPGVFAVLPPLSANDEASFRNLRLVVAVERIGDTTTSLLSKWVLDWGFYTGRFAVMPITSATQRTIASGLIYTEGGILEAQAPPSPASLTSTRDRLWLIDSDDRRILRYSKPLEANIAPEFNSALSILLPSTAGEGVVVSTVDDKPVVLCENGIYFIAGDGPNSLGTQGEFVPQIIQSDTGCESKSSIASCDAGLFFQGERGFYLLDRGLNVSRISQSVQDSANDLVYKATAVPKESQVRFGMSSGKTLVYHYELKAWTQLARTSYDATIWDGFYTRVYAAGSYGIVTTDESLQTDAEGIIEMRIITAWIKPNTMQSYSRFKKVLLLHNQDSAGSPDYGPITIDCYFNYEYLTGEAFTGVVESSTFLSADRVPAQLRSQVQVVIGKQKAQSVKFVITCPNTLANVYYDPISMEGLTLVVGTITNTQFRTLPVKTKS